MKNPGVLKHPSGNNYLHGATVTFTCKPNFFLHGDQQRTCVYFSYFLNFKKLLGKWIVVTRMVGLVPRSKNYKIKNFFLFIKFLDRSEEYALKWMTGILSSVAIILTIVIFFVMCIAQSRKRQIKFINQKYGIELQATDYSKENKKYYLIFFLYLKKIFIFF